MAAGSDVFPAAKGSFMYGLHGYPDTRQRRVIEVERWVCSKLAGKIGINKKHFPA